MSTIEKEEVQPVRKGSFVQENTKSLIFIAGAIVVLIGIYFWYQSVYLKDRAEEAAGKMYKAEQYVGVDSLANKAINGEGGYEGLAKIAEEYDNVISQTDANYLDELITYNRHLLNRNALLKQIALTRRFDVALLEILDEQLVVSGNRIFEKRKEFLADFIPLFDKHYRFLTEDAERVSLTYLSQLNDQSFSVLLTQSLDRDRILERTTVGIHKDELLFTIGDMQLKKFGSQGQQKSFLIALKLAQYSYLQQFKGFKPLLLLDDIFDKLDDKRVRKLMEMVSHHDFGQIFITDTGRTRVETIFHEISVEVKLFNVTNGTVADA